MKLLGHLTLLLITIFILVWGLIMLNSEGGLTIFLVGLITAIYAMANTFILFLSMKAGGIKRKKLGVASAIINGILLITWLVSSLDYGGLQQFEGPTIIILAIIGVANWFTVGPKLYINKKIENV